MQPISTTHTPSSTPCGKEPQRFVCATTFLTRSRQSGWAGWSIGYAPGCGRRTLRGSVASTRLWWSGRPSAGLSCWPELGQTTWFSSISPGMPSGPTTKCALLGPPDLPSPARWSHRHWRCCDQESGGRSRYRSLPDPTASFSRVLRVRFLPRGCAHLRAQPHSAQVRVTPRGLSSHRGCPGKGAEPGGHRGGGDGGAAENFGRASLREPKRGGLRVILCPW